MRGIEKLFKYVRKTKFWGGGSLVVEVLDS